MAVSRMIRMVCAIHETQIVRGPDWVRSDGYTIDATTSGTPNSQMPVMMQTLLRDRRKLTFHTEKRDLPIYASSCSAVIDDLGPD
jgi:uncharacterized protein (TIGR03435 family)